MKLDPFAWDEAIFTAIHRSGRETLDYFCAWPTHFGDPLILIVLVAAMLLIWEDGPVFKRIFVIILSTATAFACMTALNCMYKQRLWPLYFLGAFIGFTRIYVGVHFPSDVLAGAAIGTLAGWAACRVLETVNLGVGGTKNRPVR